MTNKFMVLTLGGNKKGEGRFSFTFLRREISPATRWAAFAALSIEIYRKLERIIPF
jgi:hypothetical protein